MGDSVVDLHMGSTFQNESSKYAYSMWYKWLTLIFYKQKKNQVENISMAFDCDVHRNNHEKCWKMKAHQWKSGKRCEWQGRIRRLKIQENKKTTYKSFIQIHCSIRWTIIKLSDSLVLRLSKKNRFKIHRDREEIGKKN